MNSEQHTTHLESGQNNDPRRKLARAIASRQCVLFVGAGISKLAYKLPTWEELVDGVAQDIADRDYNNQERDEIQQYRLEYLEYLHNTKPHELEQCVRKRLTSSGDSNISQIHKTIVSMPWHTIITTNVDTLLEEAFTSLGLDRIVIDSEQAISKIGYSNEPVIVKMHGSLDSKEYVLTQSQYLKFDQQRHATKAVVLSLLSRYPLLVLGAGLQDMNIQKLYAMANAALGGFQHPAYYVSRHVPAFVKHVWQQRGMEFFDVEHDNLSCWLEDVRKLAMQEQIRLHTQHPSASVGEYVKENSLECLGDALDDYELLQSRYVWTIQVSDYGWFTDSWDKTLYGPLRAWINGIIARYRSPTIHFSYCAPGPHAPALCRQVNSKISKITLYDLSEMIVKRAKVSIRTSGDVELCTEISDLSHGAGKQICDYFSGAAKQESIGDVLEHLRREEKGFLKSVQSIYDGIKHKDQGLDDARKADITYSEMVASFTGTPPLMAFRTRLFKKFAHRSHKRKELEKILRRAVRAWQKYNDIAYKIHLESLIPLTRANGFIAIAVDDCKLYDNEKTPNERSFTSKIPEPESSRIVPVDLTEYIHWRDHTSEANVRIAGIEVNDFKPHEHAVALQLFRVTDEKPSGP